LLLVSYNAMHQGRSNGQADMLAVSNSCSKINSSLEFAGRQLRSWRRMYGASHRIWHSACLSV